MIDISYRQISSTASSHAADVEAVSAFRVQDGLGRSLKMLRSVLHAVSPCRMVPTAVTLVCLLSLLQPPGGMVISGARVRPLSGNHKTSLSEERQKFSMKHRFIKRLQSSSYLQKLFLFWSDVGK